MGKVIKKNIDPTHYHKLSKILDLVSDVCGISKDTLKSTDRHRSVVDARRVYVVLSRLHLGLTLELISGFIGKDHASALYYIEQHDGLTKSDAAYRNNFRTSEQILLSNFSQITKTRSLLDLLIEDNISLKEALDDLKEKIEIIETTLKIKSNEN